MPIGRSGVPSPRLREKTPPLWPGPTRAFTGRLKGRAGLRRGRASRPVSFDGEHPAKRVETVSETEQTGAIRRVGAPNPVVGDLDEQHPTRGHDRDGHDGRLRILRRIGQSLQTQKVGGRLDLRREALIGHGDLDVTDAIKVSDRSQSDLVEPSWIDPSGEQADCFAGGLELPAQLIRAELCDQRRDPRQLGPSRHPAGRAPGGRAQRRTPRAGATVAVPPALSEAPPHPAATSSVASDAAASTLARLGPYAALTCEWAAVFFCAITAPPFSQTIGRNGPTG